jgi:hypothetical protein
MAPRPAILAQSADIPADRVGAYAFAVLEAARGPGRAPSRVKPAGVCRHELKRHQRLPNQYDHGVWSVLDD